MRREHYRTPDSSHAPVATNNTNCIAVASATDVDGVTRNFFTICRVLIFTDTSASSIPYCQSSNRQYVEFQVWYQPLSVHNLGHIFLNALLSVLDP